MKSQWKKRLKDELYEQYKLKLLQNVLSWFYVKSNDDDEPTLLWSIFNLNLAVDKFVTLYVSI